MTETEIFQAIEKLTQSNLKAKDILLMMYSLLHQQYSKPESADYLRSPLEQLQEERSPIYDVPQVYNLQKSLPALIVRSYSERTQQ